jgi:hypothetical protein
MFQNLQTQLASINMKKFILACIFIISCGLSAYSQTLSAKDLSYIGTTEKDSAEYFLITPTVERNGSVVRFMYVGGIDDDNFAIVGVYMNCAVHEYVKVQESGVLKGKAYKLAIDPTSLIPQKIKPATLAALVEPKVCNKSNELSY